jgi:cell division septal protein FtsQ
MKSAPRQYRNQRLFKVSARRHQHLLEVSMRRDKEREIRFKRIASVMFKLAVIAALGVGCWIGTKEGLRRFLWENPAFFLTDIRVTTDGTLTREQIITSSGILEGRNIFLTDLAKAREALDTLPQVERVEVSRSWPNRMDIEITERRPIAWVAARGETDPTTSERSFLIDARGYVMKARKLLPEYLHLPIISGAVTEDFAPGQRVALFEMQAALELIRLNADSTRWQVREIDVSRGYCLVVTDRNRAQITFGLDHVDRQLERFYRLLDAIAPTKREIQTVNLFVERNTPVTFVPEPVAEEILHEELPLPEKTETGSTRSKAGKAATPKPAAKKRETASSRSSSKSKGTSSEAKKAPASGVKKPFRMNG